MAIHLDETDARILALDEADVVRAVAWPDPAGTGGWWLRFGHEARIPVDNSTKAVEEIECRFGAAGEGP